MDSEESRIERLASKERERETLKGRTEETGEVRGSQGKYAPLNNLKSYAKGPCPVLARYWLMVPPRNRMRTTVVAIQKGPYRSGFPSSTSRKLARGYRAAQHRASTLDVSTSKNCA